MDIRTRAFGSALFAAFAVGMAHADSLTVSGSTGAGWQTFSSPNENGTPFWDVPSLDGPGGNIGYFLTGKGLFASNPNSPNLALSGLSYWGLSTGKADLSESLSTILNVSANLKIQVAGLAGQNSVGYYTANSISTFTTLFDGNSVLGSTASFSPNGSFGFAIKTPSTGSLNTFASQANLSTAYKANQDVAIFRYVNGANTTYYIGFEDSPFGTAETVGTGNNIGDFNDVILQLTVSSAVQPVPEASTFAAIGAVLGLAGLQGFRIYRRRA